MMKRNPYYLVMSVFFGLATLAFFVSFIMLMVNYGRSNDSFEKELLFSFQLFGMAGMFTTFSSACFHVMSWKTPAVDRRVRIIKIPLHMITALQNILYALLICACYYNWKPEAIGWAFIILWAIGALAEGIVLLVYRSELRAQ